MKNGTSFLDGIPSLKLCKGSGSSEEEYTDEFHVQPEEGTGFSPTDKAQVNKHEGIPQIFSLIRQSLGLES